MEGSALTVWPLENSPAGSTLEPLSPETEGIDLFVFRGGMIMTSREFFDVDGALSQSLSSPSDVVML